MKEASPYKNLFPSLSFRNFACTAPPVIVPCMVSTIFSGSTGEHTDWMRFWARGRVSRVYFIYETCEIAFPTHLSLIFSLVIVHRKDNNQYRSKSLSRVTSLICVYCASCVPVGRRSQSQSWCPQHNDICLLLRPLSLNQRHRWVKRPTIRQLAVVQRRRNPTLAWYYTSSTPRSCLARP